MLANCIKDCLLRFQLPLAKMRGQTYDGAANMSGAYNGCQAIICLEQPLAAYVHCSAHCSNLVANAVCSSSIMVRNAVQHVNDFGVLCNASGKLKSLFTRIAMHDYDINDGKESTAAPFRNIKPLCPTRWLVRVAAINATLDQYTALMTSLEEAKANCSPEVSARAFGLYARFQDPTTLLGLNMAQIVLSPLESLNRSLQSTTMTIAGMLEAAKTVKQQLVDMRLDEKFTLLLSKVEQQLTAFSLGPLVVPRERKPTARFSGPAEAFHTKSVETHYRIEYFKLIDVAIQQLDDRLLKCPGLLNYLQLESTLLSGQISDIVNQYPELGEIRSLQTQLDMFLSLPDIASSIHLNLETCTHVLRSMIPEMRAMFPNVESLVRLLLVNPASAATAERSFSGLRRLKTYLRSSCGQLRLNNLAICHVHKEILDTLDISSLMNEFVLANDKRAAVFGHLSR
jgi:hypothetical protein